MESVKVYLDKAAKQHASDVFIIAGREMAMKTLGSIGQLTEDRLMPDDT